MPELTDMQCLVALDDSGVGWVLVRSRHIEDTNLLAEYRADDNGIEPEWAKGLEVGVYKLTLRTRRPSSDGDVSIYASNVATLWAYE